MNFARIKTTVVENQALGRTRKRRTQQLLRKARRMTRPRPTVEDYVKVGRLDGPVACRKGIGRDATPDNKALARQVRDLYRTDPDCPARRVRAAERIRGHALDLRDRGSVGRRYLHLVYCYLRGRTYKQVENKTQTCPGPMDHNPARAGGDAVEVNKPVVANVIRAVRKEWGLTTKHTLNKDGTIKLYKEIPTEAQVALWIEKGNLNRMEVMLTLMTAEENKALDKFKMRAGPHEAAQEEHVHVRTA